MTDNELKQFYRAEYRSLYQGAAQPNMKEISIQKARANSLIKFLEESELPKISRHLDIGSSAGCLIEQLQSKFNSKGVGIEPGDAYRDYAKNRGVIVYPSLEGYKDNGDERFDFISLVHVLEHLPAPIIYLRKIRDNFLNQDGWLLIEVPNLYAHDCFEVAHLCSFSERTLCRTLVESGYIILSISKHGRPRSDLIPLYITVLARSFADNNVDTRSHYPDEHGVRFKRAAGMLRRQLVERLFPGKAWI
jgi:SAM-dependent methyltransferase